MTIAEVLGIKEFPYNLYENGNRVYHEDSNGFWIKRKYDSNRRVIYYESSNGFWSKRKYNSNGNLIYYEDSTGKMIDKR